MDGLATWACMTEKNMWRETVKYAIFVAALCASAFVAAVTPAKGLKIAINAEYGMPGSQAAQSIELGVALAIAEINARGGVLNGHQLQLTRRDDRGLPARSIDNMRELAADPDVLAVFCGRFSPVALELIPLTSELGMILLNPWAAADGIANNDQKPNFVFRLSLTDTWAIEAMMEHARKRNLKRLTVLLPNTGWGRSSMAAIERYIKARPGIKVEASWYNWGDSDFSNALLLAKRSRSDALLMVANETEGKHVMELIQRSPPAERLPVIAHWGIAAGDFNRVTAGAASSMDLVTVQTFAFAAVPKGRQEEVIRSAQRLLGVDVRKMSALVGFAHAYDLTHLLARAIDRAGSADRKAVRNAMELLGLYQGLVRSYDRPFSATNHEALTRNQVFMARYDSDGLLVRFEPR